MWRENAELKSKPFCTSVKITSFSTLGIFSSCLLQSDTSIQNSVLSVFNSSSKVELSVQSGHVNTVSENVSITGFPVIKLVFHMKMYLSYLTCELNWTYSISEPICVVQTLNKHAFCVQHDVGVTKNQDYKNPSCSSF